MLMFVAVGGAMPLTACVTLSDAAADRARTELECHAVVVLERADLSTQTFDVIGCGKKVRYTCQGVRGSLNPVCVPELAPQVESVSVVHLQP